MTQEAAGPNWLDREQYQALRRDVDACTRERATLERTCVISVVAAFIWMAQNADLYIGPSKLVWFLPIVIAVYGALKSLALTLRLGILAGYLERIERTVEQPVERTVQETIQQAAEQAVDKATGPAPVVAREGWHAHLKTRGPRRRAFMAALFWLAFVAITVFVSVECFEGAYGGDQDVDDQQTTAGATARL